jgi:hypothetical protein
MELKWNGMESYPSGKLKKAIRSIFDLCDNLKNACEV